MYILATSNKYKDKVKYYSKSGNTYTLLVAGTDYTIGTTITGTVYQNPQYDKMYMRNWGSSGAYTEFPYTINGINNLPEHDMTFNDVDFEAYTNTKGYTIRNRVRHDVISADFTVPTMSGAELHTLLNSTKNQYFDCLLFSESDWEFVSKKMYRSGTIKLHKYYIDESSPDKNIYQNVQFSFVEQ